MKKRLFIIGCTGSVGSSVLSVCRMFPDRFEIAALAANSSAERILFLAEEFACNTIVLADAQTAARVKSLTEKTVLSGERGLIETASDPAIDHVVVASSGTGAVGALMAALKSGKEVSLANKESIVVAGPWVLPLVQDRDQLRPLDSEHNAIWQCLPEKASGFVERILLTASGGPFLKFTREELERATPSMAVAHPVWSMGAKISVDSATLMNKGIEILEAMYLFGLSAEQVDAVVTPNPFIHGIVRFSDGSFHLCASAPDMGIPALVALFHPLRSPRDRGNTPLLDGMAITFQAPDEDRFPCIRLAREVARKEGAYPALLVGADEIAVDRFLSGRLAFSSIPVLIESVLEEYSGGAPKTLEEALAILEEGRRIAAGISLQLEKISPSRR
jgi:1-deoxy-D-xylulose-5-phosphate reductoisomerase